MAAIKKKINPEDALVLGVDPSLNGSGLTLMRNGEVQDYFFFTSVKKIAEASEGRGQYNKEVGMPRLDKLFNFFNFLLETTKPDYAGIEGYAYGAKSNSTFEIGGMGEMFRLLLYRAGIPYRDYEPSKVKKFACESGNAEKSQMVLQAYKSGFDVAPYGKSGEDLADAFWIGRMLTTELKLHKDANYLKKLPKYQQQAFTESSKAYPIPIINRPFISIRGV
jgi:Holliday junction resolvasome RuvABC endonuclease subunit